MLIAGAGGHSLEVLSILRDNSVTTCTFFDENQYAKSLVEGVSIISSFEKVQKLFENTPLFCLGIGNPDVREKFDQYFTKLGGNLKSIISNTSIIQSPLEYVDVMAFGFVGPKVKIQRGALVNTRAHVHHECEIGEFSEIGPGAILLGNVKIGTKCRIGAGAVILPGVNLGDKVVVGAGAVVTKNFDEGQVVAGVPAKSLI